MLGNTTMIPSVQVGAGIPLQTSSAVINPSVVPLQQPLTAQSAIPQQSLIPAQAGVIAQSAAPQMNMAPQTAGSMLSVPPGTIVPVRVGNSIVMAPTQPVQVQTQSVVQTSIPQPPPQPEYQIASYQPPVETVQVETVPVETKVVPEPMGPNVFPAPQFGQTTTPQLITNKAKVVRSTLPTQYKTVTLPAKVVTERLPPIGPPPTPELNIPLPPPPVETYIPPEPVQTYQPVQSVQQVKTVMVPQVKTVMVPQVKTVMVPQTQVSMTPQYQTTSVPMVSTVGQLAQPKYGSTSVIAQY